MRITDSVLALLENGRGQSISGEYMANRLHVSRSAVWKAIRALKKDGYAIEAVTNKGYCLCEENDRLSAQGMLPFLSQAEQAERIFVHDRVESTNKTAKEMAVSGAGHGIVVIADSQTAGRGRYGRSFYSPSGCGIYMSFILYPEQLKLEIPTLITAFIAVSVCEAIEAVSPKKPQIKWVNDIFLEGKKVCGILTEAVTDFESGGIQWAVAGIGVNFSARMEDFPESLRPIAGSVFPGGGRAVTRNRLAAEIVNRVTAYGSQYGKEEILRHYRKRLMMLGKRVRITGAGDAYEAVAVDIDETGRLLVKRDNGAIQALSAGEIHIQL